ncbi:ubiquinone biosynthesis regulatory protein kinase UbiB [Vreelandella titanicae]|uniref:ubiquinone biosynthesis regulatory protein kinase UbiB n=1 Tax=Halomonadaceae TaxID=28256 RepID=UPI00034576B0|nr:MULTISPECIES: ubiquinone biosynthesis regulatory protein kinase UbiB [Halomonas]UEQ03117.1 ubiquinone biosynthesis regulatory protein kinase UbiB [Halomonas profundus]KIN13056.1 ubiquinone biosynthesis protein UbiB [Halomonas sp. KHS3]MCD1586770.1 ubiquinone biosynthesis regulatory protein kinase UbiB [Halomonas sp. IOP_14]MCE7520094.1 ubiquinone biosynthesis regulatory protein kinase UbiB [Halomonas titanicae]NVE91782.1 ubiquinone biosynthesis regulatory protein kinase UbiB [Halomonas tita|tara:strand:+ start:685 stop:2307 length:1623 start_codon:yes stop_codon:yes gene_type:complete
MSLRLLRISWVISRHRLDTLLPLERLPWWLRALLWFSPLRLIPVGKRSRGERLRLSLEALGPIFIKFGQMLSTRRDLLPADIADELKRLQDQVPPFPGDQAADRVEKALEMSLEEAFAEFDRVPLASASIAQVHAARLHGGEDVVVKIIRPGIDRVMRQDMALMYQVAKLFSKIPEARRLRPVEVIRDYEATLFDELDLYKEAANTSQLKRNFKDSPLLFVPTIYWPFTRRHVMVQERIRGIPVADLDTLIARGTNLKKLAERGVELFFTQVFRDNFFHADMHPGNIFVNCDNPEDPQYIAIDCGIVGSLTREDQDYLARNLLAFFHQDYYEVAALHIESGWVGENTRANEFAAAIRTVCEPILEKPLKDISFGQVLLGLFQTARRFNMEVQPQLVLLQKTLLNIEGLGRQLYPDLDLWSTAKPYLEQWMKERAGVSGLWESLKRQAPELSHQLPELPVLAHQALSRMEHEHRQRHQQVESINDMRVQMARQGKRLYRLRLGLILLALALAWQPLSGWIALQEWPILAAAAIGLLLLVWQ